LNKPTTNSPTHRGKTKEATSKVHYKSYSALIYTAGIFTLAQRNAGRIIAYLGKKRH